MMVESAVDAGVRARVGDVHRNIHRNGLAEPLLRVSAAQPGHRLQVGGRRRRDERHEVVEGQVLFRKCSLYIRRTFVLNLPGRLLPVVFG